MAEPLKAAIPTQDTEDWPPLGWLAPKLGQGSLVLPDPGQLLWEKGPPSDVKGMGWCPSVQTTWTAPTAFQVPLSTYRVLRHCYVALRYQARLKHALFVALPNMN